MRTMRFVITVGFLCCASSHGLTIPINAQEKSVKPGINDSFKNAQARNWVERWEREGREVFDQRQKILGHVGIKEGDVVADIGAGSGLYTRLFSAEVGDVGRVFAVDITTDFVHAIVIEARKKKINNVIGVICSDKSCDLPKQSIDIVFISATYHHFEFPLKTMASIHTALRDRGRVVIVDFERIPGKSSEFILGHVRADKETVRQEIESCNFKFVEEKKGFLQDNYMIVFEKKSTPKNSSANATGKDKK